MKMGAFIFAVVLCAGGLVFGWLLGGAFALVQSRGSDPQATLFIGYLGAAVALTAALIAIWGVYSQRVLTRRQTTIQHIAALRADSSIQATVQKFIELSRGNQNLAKWADEENIGKEETLAIIAVLNDYELIAVGIQQGIYEYDLVKCFSKSTIIRFWSAAHPFVIALRNRTKVPTIWQEFEKLNGWVSGKQSPFKALWWVGIR
ncbi:DUF4760 domain-containing protein [Brevundimonas variabilis]|uniref:DUF4760 domain-containing protein n=1 Tax=Brevundimonas variabilis TaxID=74312 RepID=A0A7W9FEL6_9CAUL|nr:DUF4760 domain-containing protein [Brevundimonas variabilis]MBB5744658.1 hypothetical protein [Brevundimonas variabilis]